MPFSFYNTQCKKFESVYMYFKPKEIKQKALVIKEEVMTGYIYNQFYFITEYYHDKQMLYFLDVR